MRNNKGKVHPSSDEPLSVLSLLPAAILTLTCLLSVEDKQVLAYMITRSMKSTTTNASKTHHHKPPLFHCDCFDCYTIFWFRWDSSPNRDLIHRAIEAFEEHLNSSDDYQKKKNRKKDKSGRRGLDSPARLLPQIPASSPRNSPEPGKCETTPLEDDGVVVAVTFPETTSSAGRVAAANIHKGMIALPETTSSAGRVVAANNHNGIALPETTSSEGRVVAANNHKGFARKVLPDVLGVFNSRLWNLWSPNL